MQRRRVILALMTLGVLALTMHVVGEPNEVWAGQDILEVKAAAEGVAGSARTWAFWTFIGLAAILGFLALRYEHTGLYMATATLVLLAVVSAKGPEAIARVAGLVEGATLESVQPASTAPTPDDMEA